MLWRWGRSGLREGKSERENDRRALRFKLNRLEADWVEADRQEDDWTRTVMSALSFESL